MSVAEPWETGEWDAVPEGQVQLCAEQLSPCPSPLRHCLWLENGGPEEPHPQRTEIQEIYNPPSRSEGKGTHRHPKLSGDNLLF